MAFRWASGKLVLFSDGIPVALGAGGESFGFQRLQRLLEAPGSAQTLHDRILLAFDDHVRDEPITDDLTLVVVARDPL